MFSASVDLNHGIEHYNLVNFETFCWASITGVIIEGNDNQDTIKLAVKLIKLDIESEMDIV